MNRWKFSPYFQLFCLIVFGACTPEYEVPLQAEGSLTFQIKESYVAHERSRKLETPVQGVSNVVLTILNADDTPTAIDSKSLPALTFGEELMIEDIRLPAGSYQLSSFHLTDSSGNILYATPLEGSDFGDYLSEPLPISFEISTNGTESLGLEIISTAGQNPESFGFESGMAGFRETFYFFMSVIREKVDEFMEFVPAELTVSQGYQIVTQTLSGKLNKIVLPKNSDQYDFLISYGPFQPISKKISYDSLLLFQDRPMIVEMSKKRDDEFYVGGSFEGNVYLSTQTALDSFGRKGYDVINGDLTIGNTPPGSDDPITDLSPLASIDVISRNFIISGNPILKSLEGLQFLRWISQFLIFKDNPAFESLKGMTSLQYIRGLDLINNPAMRDFGGLSQVCPTLERLHIERMEHFVGLDAFENATSLLSVTILSNPNVTHFDFPRQKERLNSRVRVTNNPSLVSFGGSESGFIYLRGLTLENNENLDNLQGLLQPDGDGVREIIIKSMPKITSLSPLFLSELVGEIYIENNESLEDITAISSARTIFSDITIVNNPKLQSLNGFSGEMELYYFVQDHIESYPGELPYVPVKILIKDNKSLTDFCGLKDIRITLVNRNPFASKIEGNAFNPSLDEIRGGICKP